MRTSIAILTMLTASAAVAEPAGITLLFDDSKNPAPYQQIHFAANWSPETGEYTHDWSEFKRYPMHDDGAHGDGAAGDRVWGARVNVEPLQGQVFEWATDSDAKPENGWINACGGFMVESADSLTIMERSMPEEAYLTSSAFALRHGLNLSQPSPPRRVSSTGAILFTVSAPNAKRVFLAGDFNNWADNEEGKIKDFRAQMYPAENGLWYRMLPLKGEAIRYKYVLQNGPDEFNWISDPMGKATDADGNTMLDLRKLYDESIASDSKRHESPQAVEWRRFSPLGMEQTLRDHGKVLVYVRLGQNPRCNAFERKYLLSEETKRLLAGSTVYFVDASETDFRSDLRDMGIMQVPALASKSREGVWQTLVFQDSTEPGKVLEFLATFADSGPAH
jgi:hypothetical protein